MVEKANLLVVTVPKCGCSSIKRFAHAVNTGDREAANIALHKRYRSLPKEQTDKVFGEEVPAVAVIRHPVDRILSCYFNKVRPLGKGKGHIPTRDALLEAGLPLKISPLEFIKALPAYQEASQMLAQHSRPLEHFLGSNPARFERLFDISEMPAFAEVINHRAGTTIEITRSNRSQTPPQIDDLDEVIERILREFENDMTIYGTWIKTTKWAPGSLGA